jgi:XTP/dITP diphosphohydrolase
MNGRIAIQRAGKCGFGYDPVFIADEYPTQTVAEISEEQKNAISHRGKAMRAMADFLHSNK